MDGLVWSLIFRNYKRLVQRKLLFTVACSSHLHHIYQSLALTALSWMKLFLCRVMHARKFLLGYPMDNLLCHPKSSIYSSKLQMTSLQKLCCVLWLPSMPAQTCAFFLKKILLILPIFNWNKSTLNYSSCVYHLLNIVWTTLIADGAIEGKSIHALPIQFVPSKRETN